MTLHFDDFTVSYDDTPEIHKKVFDYLIREYYSKYGYFSGEGIMQADNPQIYAPQVLSDLADDVIGFKEDWADDEPSEEESDET